MSETVMVAAAVTEATETAIVEEPITINQEIIDPVSTTKEESIPKAASPLPVTVTEEHDEPKQEESVSSEEASVCVEEDILEFTAEIIPTHTEMVQSSRVEDVRSSVETDVWDISPAADAVPAACVPETSLAETTSETIMGTEETLSETVATDTIATEDVLVSTGLTVDTDVVESIVTGEMPVYEDLETEIISSEAPTIIDTAAVETHVTEEPVSESAPLPVAVEELICFENTARPVLDVPVQVQTFPDLALDPLLDPLEDTMPVLKPVLAQEPEQEEHTPVLPVKPEDILEPAVPLQAEPEVSTPVAAPAEGNVAQEEAGPEGAEEAAEDLEAEMNEEVNIRL